MDSIFHGRSLVPPFEISRPPLKPPWSTCLSEIDSNQAFQAFMISRVGFSNPRCRNINFFTSLSFRFTGVLKGLPAGKVWLTIEYTDQCISIIKHATTGIYSVIQRLVKSRLEHDTTIHWSVLS